MKFLITGGAGFIGSNLADRVVANGDSVRILDNFSSGHRSNLDGILGKVELIEGNVCDYETVASAMANIDFVLHHAAIPSVPRSVDNPIASNDANIGGTLNVLEAARKSKARKVVLASSSAIYGESDALPKVEDMLPEPPSPYAITKITGEYYCAAYWKLHRLPTVSLRYFNVFGPRQDPNGDYAAVIPKFITALLSGRKPIVFGDGGQTRDFLYIDNVVEANLQAVSREDMNGDSFNVAAGERYTLNQLLESLQKLTDKATPATYAEERAGDIRHSYADICKITSHGFKLSVDFEEGLRRTVAYFRKQTDSSDRVTA
ncbi:MAG: SDR family oxidoreductase [Candidatus Zixiibacteriota bacterium]